MNSVARERRCHSATTITDLLRLQSERQPEALAYRFLPSGDSDGSAEEWSYGHVERRARSVAAHLQRLGAASGDRALLLYAAGLELIAAFLGSLYAAVIAVPAYPPSHSFPFGGNHKGRGVPFRPDKLDGSAVAPFVSGVPSHILTGTCVASHRSGATVGNHLYARPKPGQGWH
jgi:hypothetical protein